MSNNGILVIIANIDTENKVLLGTPAVTTRGYILVNENEDLIRDIQSISQGIINKCLKSKYFNYNDMKSEIINGLIHFFLIRLVEYLLFFLLLWMLRLKRKINKKITIIKLKPNS